MMIGVFASQCAREESLMANDKQSAGSPSIRQDSKANALTNTMVPKLNKPCLDPTDSFRKTFHPGDTIFANGVNLGNEVDASTMLILKSGSTNAITEVPLTIVTADFTRGWFVFPTVSSEGYYEVKIKVGAVTGNNSEVFTVKF
ncbi:hypothetical protein WSM22_40910 [Cytophagales bacterium WSM2-2]|nr:hypothetical protein WSM22_40910 [Cytophagales bacterium WSM2-2]